MTPRKPPTDPMEMLAAHVEFAQAVKAAYERFQERTGRKRGRRKQPQREQAKLPGTEE